MYEVHIMHSLIDRQLLATVGTRDEAYARIMQYAGESRYEVLSIEEDDKEDGIDAALTDGTDVILLAADRVAG